MRVLLRFLIVFSLLVNEALSQDLVQFQYKSITDQNGLPSNEVYDIVEDQEGYIWFATDRGVSKYNGVSHQIFNSRNGLKGDAVFHLFKQSDTSIVCVNNVGSFYRIKNGLVEELIPEDSIKKYIGLTEFPFSFMQTPDGNFHIGTRFNRYIFDRKGNRIRFGVEEVVNSLNVNYKNGTQPFCYFSRPFDGGDLKSIQVRLNEQVVHEEKISNHYSHRSFYPSKYEKTIVIPLEYSFLLIDEKNNILRHELNDRVLSTYITDKQIFICSDNGLYVYYYTEGNLELCSHLLKGISVSSVLQTDNGKVWISTIENGVRYYDLRQPQLLNLEVNNINLSAFDYHEGKILTGSYRGHLTSFDFSFQNSKKRKIYSIKRRNEDFYILDGGIYDSPAKFKTDSPIKTNTGEIVYAWNLIEFRDNLWLTTLGSKMVLFDHEAKVGIDTIFVINGINDVDWIKNKVYVASNNSVEVYLFENQKLLHEKKIEVRDVDKLFIFKNSLSGVTRDYRLFRIKENYQIEWLNLMKSKGFSLVTAAEASEQIIHIGTNKGIYSWKPSMNWDSVKLVGYENVPNPISIKIFEDTLLFATKKNVYRKALNDIRVELPSIELKKILVDGKVQNAKEIIRIGYDHQNIEIPLGFTNYTSNPILFRYVIRNLNTEFVYTAESTIRINTLPPGNYLIEVSASVDEVNYTPIEKVEINVDFPYWRKWPFILGSCFLMLSLLFLLYKIRVNKLKKKHLLQESIMQLKAQALGSQLNPHLIFNVLNSIQGLVSEGEIEEANIYIARFSKFIRISLRYLEVTQIPLSEEIEITEQYIEIEKLRFEDEVSFSIEASVEGAKNLMVPPLIIQPIIENAIKHGLMPSKLDLKVLKVRILQEGRQIIIEVEDNGTGFKENYTQSIGMSVTDSRIKLLNSKNQLIIKSRMNPTLVQLILFNED